MLNLKGRKERSGGDPKDESDEEFVFMMTKEAEDSYRRSNRKKEPKQESMNLRGGRANKRRKRR